MTAFQEGEGVEFELEQFARFERQQDRLVDAIRRLDAATARMASILEDQQRAGERLERDGAEILEEATSGLPGSSAVVLQALRRKKRRNRSAIARGKRRNRGIFASMRRR